MRIPNKFNGYSRDGIRLYNDPLTVTATLSAMGETAAVAGAAEGLGALSAGAGALGSMTGGMELAAMTNAATPALFNPATVGGLAESMTLANGIGLPGLMQGAGIAEALPFGMSTPASYAVDMIPQEQLFNPLTEASASDPLQLAQEGAKETLEGVDTSEKLGSMDTGINAAKGLTGNSTIDDLINLAKQPNWSNIKDFANANPKTALAMGLAGLRMMQPKTPTIKQPPQYIRPYTSNRQINPNVAAYQPYSGGSTGERNWFTGGLQAQPIYRAATGGLTALAIGGPVETMSAENAVGQNLNYPQSQLQTSMYSNPMVQRPVASNVIKSGVDMDVDPYTGEEKFAAGGMSNRVGQSMGADQNLLDNISAARNADAESMGALRNAGYQMNDLQKYGTGYASGGEAGGYTYTYDPKTQQFTQLSEPALDYGNGLIGKLAAQQPNLGLFGYGGYRPPTPAPKPFTPIVTGGVTKPATQQAAQAPVQQDVQMPINIPAYQTPEQQLGLENFYDYMNQQLSGMHGFQGYAAGGDISHLGDYSDGGRLLRGPGDGVSDSIPASIGGSRPARLADGEFVIPARIVSEIGNGSTEAGARKLYAMMDRVQNARKKSVGKERVAVDSKADKYLPA